MYLAPEGDELEVANAAATFLRSAVGIERLHKANSADMGAATRKSFGEMGWLALAVPEAEGGSGLSAVEHALFFREAGRQCAPIDLLAQCLAANVATEAKRRAAIMAGEIGVALIVADQDHYRLLGSPESTLGLLVTGEGASLYSLANLAASLCPSLDPANSMRKLGSLTAPVESRGDNHVWHLGQLGTAAMLVGMAEAALDLIVEYAKVRETFGRKIGAYQAVRHSCADMALRVEAARSQLYYAATALKEGHGDAEAHLDAAKHMANQAALANADANIQLHGGIGVTDEHDAHLLLKHAMLLSRLFGSKRALLSRLLNARLSD